MEYNLELRKRICRLDLDLGGGARYCLGDALHCKHSRASPIWFECLMTQEVGPVAEPSAQRCLGLRRKEDRPIQSKLGQVEGAFLAHELDPAVVETSGITNIEIALTRAGGASPQRGGSSVGSGQ